MGVIVSLPRLTGDSKPSGMIPPPQNANFTEGWNVTWDGSFNLGSNVTIWHLRVLLKFGCVQEIRHKSSLLFALPQISLTEVILVALIRKDLNRKILKALESQTLSLSSLESILGEERRNIEYAIKNLQEFAIIEKIPQVEPSTSNMFKINPAIATIYFKWAKSS